MIDDPRVAELLEELLDSGSTHEEVCRASPELLPRVRARWQRLRAIEEQIGGLFSEDRAVEGHTRTCIA
jgi:serine/threonine-protein kinase